MVRTAIGIVLKVKTFKTDISPVATKSSIYAILKEKIYRKECAEPPKELYDIDFFVMYRKSYYHSRIYSIIRSIILKKF